MTSLLLSFPEGYTPNNPQVKILKSIEKHINNGVKYIIINAPTGCLTGDTEIMLNRSGNGGRMTLFEAYCKTHGNPMDIPKGFCGCGCGNRVPDIRSKCIRGHHSYGIKWKNGLPKIRSLLGNQLGSQPILDIVYSGKKKVYELTLNNGMVIRGTNCHPILTNRGYVPLGQLDQSVDILIDPIWDKFEKTTSKKTKLYDLHISGLTYHPYARRVATKKYKDGFTFRVPKHVFIFEAFHNNITTDELKLRCKSGDIGGLLFVNPRLDVVHHKDNNHYNNDVGNLQLMTHEDHDKHHGKDNIVNFGYFKPTYAWMVDRKYIGVEDTFDVQCPNPHHNFVANGIVVHNSGKSFIPKTIANSVNGPSDAFKKCVDDYSIFSENGGDLVEADEPFGVYALTITKSLQDQYKNTFDDTGILKGQSNYKCALDDTLSVDIAPCIYVQGLKNDCWKHNKCPYYNSRNEMLKQKFSSLNYSMFFSLPEHLKKRKIIICDEGSELEEQLVGQFSCEIDIPFLVKTGTQLTSFPTQETPVKVVSWLNELIASVVQNIEDYKKFLKDSKGSPEYFKKSGEYTKLINLQGNLQILVSTYYDSEYIIEKENKIIKFTPLKVDKLSQYIFNHADHIIIMSATIIDHKNFCKNLGISKYEYIEVDTEFDHSKGPIHIMVKQKLNYSNLKGMLPTLANQVEGILKEHACDKGIIHTHTQYIADYMRDNVKTSRLLCREAGVKNEDILELHEKTHAPTVLVSPSMTYGVDLKGDLAKFQIILKAPWLPTKDKRVEKMMKLDKQWYSNKMLCSLVQACGRGIRSIDDECVTYILDGSIFDVIIRNKPKLPTYFIDRFQ
jgi:hypothetical protein